MGFFSGLAGAVVGSVGSLFGAHQDRKAQRSMQGHLDSRDDTKYQRMVTDLKAAGLNPALAYGGATPGSPPQAQQSNAYSSAASNVASLINAAGQRDIQKANLEAQRDNIVADTDLKKQEAINKEIEANGKQLDNALKTIQGDNEKLKGKLISAQTEHERRKILETDQRTRNLTVEQKNRLVELATKEFDLQVSKQDPRKQVANMIEMYKLEVADKKLNQAERNTKVNMIKAQIQNLVSQGKITEAEAKSWENSLFMRNYKSVIGAISDTVRAVKGGVDTARSIGAMKGVL